MKIGFPVLKEEVTDQILLDSSFHSCKLFGIYNSSDESLKVLSVEEIVGNGDTLGVLPFLQTEQIEKVISPTCLPMAGKFFSSNGIHIYKADGALAIESIEKLLRNELDCFTADTVEKSGCNSDCGSCSTSCSTTSESTQDMVMI